MYVFRRLLLFLILLLGFFACEPVPLTPTSSKPRASLPSISQHSQSMIGGKADDRFLAIGALTASRTHFCTAVLVSPRVVMTAAHCIDTAKNYAQHTKIQFRIDEARPDTLRTYYLDLDASLMFTHPKWQQAPVLGFDLGFAVLKQKTTRAKPIPVYTQKINQYWIGQKVLLSGYGLLKSVPKLVRAERKHSIEIPIVHVSSDRFLHFARGKSICHGDSGGPVLREINGLWQVVGVNSYVTARTINSIQRSSCLQAGVSARLDIYQDFIEQILKKYQVAGTPECEKDADCGACGRCDKKVCTEGISAASPQTKHCLPCKSDKDCEGTSNSGVCVRLKDGFRCVQNCSSRGCCPGNAICAVFPKRGGASKLCIPPDEQCKQARCNADQDCGIGESCQGQDCVSKPIARHKKLCVPCREDKDCLDKGHLCVGSVGRKHCSQPCAEGERCPTGFRCRQLFLGSPKQCLPEGSSCPISCKGGLSCPPGFQCDNDLCSSQKPAGYNESCENRSCKSPLECVTRGKDKRCLQTCSTTPGTAGALCKTGNKCDDNGRCALVFSGGRRCFKACVNDNNCKQFGGKYCSGRSCVCMSEADCLEGYRCQFIEYGYGACVKKEKFPSCPEKQSCQYYANRHYCFSSEPGQRILGEPCDAIYQCRKGLHCLRTRTGSTALKSGTCVEDCTAAKRCRSGGYCLPTNEGVHVCQCRGDASCPPGRYCGVKGQFEICLPQQMQTQPACKIALECGQGQACESGKCVPKTSKHPEHDPFWEPPPYKEEEPEQAEKPDNTPDGGDGLLELFPPEGNKPLCQCSSSSEPPVGVGLFLLLFLLGWIRLKASIRGRS